MQPAIYRIRVRGHLDSHWSDWFEGFDLRHHRDGTTLLSGPVADQAALYGMLERLRDLGLTLLSVNPAEFSQETFGESKSHHSLSR
ncbi:MAG: hypothetical protein PVH17_02150 [Anaerolineae bacterium]|jgi:hypothetical protein